MTRAGIEAVVVAAVAVAACGGAGPVPTSGPAACPDAPVLITSQDEVDAFPGCPLLPGLTLRTGLDLDLSRSQLQHVHAIDGDLVIGPSVGLAGIELRELSTVRGTVRVVGDGNLITLALPHLIRAGTVSISADIELRSVSLPALADVDHDLVIERTPELAVVDLTALRTIGGELAISDAPALVALEAPSLSRATSVRLERTGLGADEIATLLSVSSTSTAPRQ